MDERTILRKAKGVLLERGWHQGAYCADPLGLRGPVCVEGAIRTVMSGDPYGNLLVGGVDALECLADLVGGSTWDCLPKWNDDIAESIDDVVGLIDRALASLPAEAPELEKAVA
jgi:hypothetical protein